MGNTLPEWIQILSALLTPAIGGAVATIGYLQWRTAHQRVVVDLFDQRINTYYAIADVIAEVTASGSAKKPDEVFQLGKAMLDAKFLFGRDVEQYLDSLRKELIDMQLAEDMISENNEDHANWVAGKYQHFRKILQFYDLFPDLCEPYLRLDQKRVRTPLRWAIDFICGRRSPPRLKKPDGEVG